MLSPFETLRVAVLCSRRAPGLDVLLHHPHRRSLYDIACVMTTEADFPDREWMMRGSWGALVIRAFEHISAGMEMLDLASAL
jgi:hypothetical protein